jgi:hypothetical protein
MKNAHFKCTVISQIKRVFLFLFYFYSPPLSLLPEVIRLSLSITPSKRVFKEVLNGAVLGGSEQTQRVPSRRDHVVLGEIGHGNSLLLRQRRVEDGITCPRGSSVVVFGCGKF